MEDVGEVLGVSVDVGDVVRVGNENCTMRGHFVLPNQLFLPSVVDEHCTFEADQQVLLMKLCVVDHHEVLVGHEQLLRANLPH